MMSPNTHDETSYIELQHPTPSNRRTPPGLAEETAQDINNYLSSMSPLAIPEGPEIVGTPSDVAVRLNHEIERYLPSKRTMLRTEVSGEVSDAEEKLGRRNTGTRESPVGGRCPAAFSLKKIREEDMRARCPGIVDVLSRQKVPCERVRTLRDVAYGRKMPRPHVHQQSHGQSRFSREEDDEYLWQEDEIIRRRGRDGEEQCCERRRVRRAAD